MGVKPFLHVGLVLVFGRLVSEYVGVLARFFVIVGGCRGLWRWRASWENSRCLSEMVVGDLARWDPKRLGIDPGDGCDGCPVGADFGVRVVVSKGAAWVLPTCLVGSSM